jgi:hypothetical protein
MQTKDSSNRDTIATNLRVEYTDKPVSGWGGLIALQRFFEKIGVYKVLKMCLPDGRTSPNQIPVIDIVLSLITSILTGGKHFAHVERLRNDEVISSILGIRRMPSATTIARYFSGLVRSQIELIGKMLNRFILERLPCPSLGMLLDMDSTVLERFGRQEGSRTRI